MISFTKGSSNGPKKITELGSIQLRIVAEIDYSLVNAVDIFDLVGDFFESGKQDIETDNEVLLCCFGAHEYSKLLVRERRHFLGC